MTVSETTRAAVASAIQSLQTLEAKLDGSLIGACHDARLELQEYEEALPSMAKYVSVHPKSRTRWLREVVKFLQRVTPPTTKRNFIIDELTNNEKAYVQILVARSDEAQGIRQVLEPSIFFLDKLADKSALAGSRAKPVERLLASFTAWRFDEDTTADLLAPATKMGEYFRDIEAKLSAGERLEALEHSRILSNILQSLQIEDLSQTVAKLGSATTELKAVNKDLGEELERIIKFEKGAARCSQILGVAGLALKFLAAV